MRIATLICHRDVGMGTQCLRSLAWAVEGAQVVLHDDGSLTPDDVDRLRGALPVARVVPRAESDAAMEEALRRHPACARARRSNVLMLKLFDVALMEEGDIRYCDTDVLFLRRATGLMDWGAAGYKAVFMRDANHAYSARPWHLVGRRPLALPQFLNSGLFMFRRDAYDLDYLEWLLARETIQDIFRRVRVWAEQTCWAALAYRAGCGLWDAGRIAVVNDRWSATEATVAAHFVSSARHRLDELLPCACSNPAAVQVPIAPAQRCTAVTLAKTQVARRLRRACGF